MNKVPAEEGYTQPHDPLSLELLVGFFWRHKWTLLATAVLGLGLSILATSFLTPTYKTSAVLFATQTNSSRKLLEEQQFGFDIHADRLIQILESDRVRDSVIQRFDLVKHYEIDTGEIDWRDQLMTMYHSRIRFSRTIYMSVVVEVIDTDPQYGADIANAIVDMVDFVRGEILRENSLKTLKWLEAEYHNKLREVKEARDSLELLKRTSRSRREEKLSGQLGSRQQRISSLESELAKMSDEYRTQNFDATLSRLNQELEQEKLQMAFFQGKINSFKEGGAPDSSRVQMQAELEGVKAKVRELEARIAEVRPGALKYGKLSSELERLKTEQNLFNSEISRLQVTPELTQVDLDVAVAENEFQWDLTLLNELKKDYETALSVHEDPLPETYKVSQALPSHKKHSPVMWLNGLVGMLLPLFFVTLILILRERLRKVPV